MEISRNIKRRGPAWQDHHGGVLLLDDGRARKRLAGPQSMTIVDGGVAPSACEEDEPVAPGHRRFIRGGAVRLGGEVVLDEKLSLKPEDVEGRVLQVGKRRYVRFARAR